MTLQIFDTMQRRKVPFESRRSGEVAMYVCGPTVYDVPHLGHGRTALTYDMIRRYLGWSGFVVTMASNVTDIDDNIIRRAEIENRTESDVADEFTIAYDKQMSRLEILPADSRPHATQFIEGMIDVIGQLLKNGAAYELDGKGIYFSVQNDTSYGKLAGRSLDQLLEDAGSRVGVDESKNSPLDFALWKSAKPGEPSWETPWGKGRPGWHTECVAMSLSALGEGFDIHGGGDDLTFPHHQNELAQVNALGKPFARHWIHSSMVNVSGEKMSKSLGNFTNLEEAIDIAGPRALRLLALQTHYRKAMEMGGDSLMAASEAVKRLDSFGRRMAQASVMISDAKIDEASKKSFISAMDDDFSTPSAVDTAFRLMRQANAALDDGNIVDASKIASSCVSIFAVLGISIDTGARIDTKDLDVEIETMMKRRFEARSEKNFAVADQIRDELLDMGITVEDTPNGAVWFRS
ncbi:MAG: cysteine--tRNA ligase [Actinomycetota bacterium]|nr:cysteine--tRNA ligase [Actinomycetota bacterium]MDG1488828.1 cysteine--tRNA ligase [Actinomycetota bacterium]MDG2121410.1 cysteine--tRNA ligase [Actinomycetota bacterium]